MSKRKIVTTSMTDSELKELHAVAQLYMSSEAAALRFSLHEQYMRLLPELIKRGIVDNPQQAQPVISNT